MKLKAFWVLAVLFLGLSIGFVACGGDDSSTSSGQTDDDDDVDDDVDDDTDETTTTTTTTVPTVTSTTTSTTTTTTTTVVTTSSTTTTTGAISPGFVFIPSGAFTMGSPGDEPGRGTDENRHEVTLTGDFEIMTTEATQDAFYTLMGWDPSGFTVCGLDCPVEMVSWLDSVAYANELSADLGLADCYLLSDVLCEDGTNAGSSYMNCMNNTQGGIESATIALNGVSSVYDCEGYRLPTEAEWEYAIRAGTTTAFYDGLDSDDSFLYCETPFHLTDIGWYCGNQDNSTEVVGQKQANAWGLYDMSGNVLEWTWDWYDSYPGTVTDPEGPVIGSYRVNRGGGWGSDALGCRSANRFYGLPGYRYSALGFRLARSIE